VRLRWTIFLPAVVGGDSAARPKPNPGSPSDVAQQFAIGADRALMVGDNIHGVEAAHAVGMCCVAVSHGYHQRPPSGFGADRFEELLSLLMNPTPDRTDRRRRENPWFPLTTGA